MTDDKQVDTTHPERTAANKPAAATADSTPATPPRATTGKPAAVKAKPPVRPRKTAAKPAAPRKVAPTANKPAMPHGRAKPSQPFASRRVWPD